MVVDNCSYERDNDAGIEWWQTTGQYAEITEITQEKKMGLVLKGSTGGGTEFAPLSSGSHAARCFAVIDLGTQRSSFLGKEKSAQKIRISWEVCGERMTDGRPMVISKEYTASLWKGDGGKMSRLREDLERWRNKGFTEVELEGFESKQLLGKPCLLAVKHTEKDGKVYANVDSVSTLPKGMEVPPAENEHLYLDLEAFDQKVFEKLSKWVQATIEKSPEYAANKGWSEAGQTPALEDEDIPF